MHGGTPIHYHLDFDGAIYVDERGDDYSAPLVGAARHDAIDRLLDAISVEQLNRAVLRRPLGVDDTVALAQYLADSAGPAAGGDVQQPAAGRDSDERWRLRGEFVDRLALSYTGGDSTPACLAARLALARVVHAATPHGD